MQLTFRQIRDLRDSEGLSSMSVEEFAKMRQADDTENDWSHGLGNQAFKHLGLGLTDIHTRIGEGLANSTGMSEEAGKTASSLGTTIALAEGGAAIGSVVPGVGNVIGGLGGAALGGLLTAAEVYSDTNSGKAATAAGALGLALPIGAGAGGKYLATGIAKKLGNKMVTDAAGNAVFKAFSPRLFEVAGHNVGMAGGTLASQGATSAVMAPSGHKMEAFGSVFSEENILHAGIVQSLFAGHGAYKAIGAYKPVGAIKPFSPSETMNFAERGTREGNRILGVETNEIKSGVTLPGLRKDAAHNMYFDTNLNRESRSDSFTTDAFTRAWNAPAKGPFGKVTEVRPDLMPFMSPGEVETVKLNKVKVSIGGVEEVYRSYVAHSQDQGTGQFKATPIKGLTFVKESTLLNPIGKRLTKVQTMSSAADATNLLYEQQIAIDKFRSNREGLPKVELMPLLESDEANSRAAAIRVEERLATMAPDHPARPTLEKNLLDARNRQNTAQREIDLNSEDNATRLIRIRQDIAIQEKAHASAKERLRQAPNGDKKQVQSEVASTELALIDSKNSLAREQGLADTQAEAKRLGHVEHFMGTLKEKQAERAKAAEKVDELENNAKVKVRPVKPFVVDLLPKGQSYSVKGPPGGASKKGAKVLETPTIDGSETVRPRPPEPPVMGRISTPTESTPPSNAPSPDLTYGKELTDAVKTNRVRADQGEGPLQKVVAVALENAAASKRATNPVDDLVTLSTPEIDVLLGLGNKGTKSGNTETLLTEEGYANARDDLSIFRHLVPEMDGTPVSNVEVLNFAKAKRGNSAVEMAQLHYALKMAGLHGAENLKMTSRLLALWKHQVKFNSFEGAVGKHGMFTENKGLQEVWLNAISAENVRNGLLFTLSHELNGHGIWEAHRNGELPANMSKALTEFVAKIESSTEKENSDMLRELHETLPGELKRDIAKNDLLNIKGKNSEEVLANFNALVSLTMAATSKAQQKALAVAAPGLIRPVLSAMSRFSKGVLDSLNVARKPDVAVLEYHKALGEFFKIDEIDAHAKEQALLLAGIQDGGGLWHEMFQENNSRIAYMMKQPGVDQIVKYLEISPKEKSRWYDRSLEPLQVFGQQFPVLRKLLYTFQEQKNSFNRFQSETLATLSLTREGHAGGQRWVADKGGDYYKVTQSEKMSSVQNAIVHKANRLEGRVSDNLKDVDISTELAKLTTDERDKVMNSIGTMEQLQQKNVSVMRDMRYEDLARMSALVAMKRGVHVDSETALAEAQQYINDIRTTGASPIKPVYEELVVQQAKRYEDDFSMQAARPWYVSEQRFSEFKFRATKKPSGGKLQEEFNGDANSEKELLSMMAAKKADGWVVKRVVPTSGLRSHKELLSGLLAQEQAQATYLRDSLSLVIKDPLEVNAMMAKFNMAELLQKEVAAQEKPMSLHRRGVDGYQNLDVVKQQLLSVDIVGRALTKKIAKSHFELFASDPKVAEHESLDHIRQAFAEFMAPDHRLTQKVNSLNYGMFMSLHFLNMIQDGLAPLIGVLPGNLFNEGSTMTGAYMKVLRGMGKAINPKKLSSDEKLFIDEFDKNNDALSMYTDGANNDVLAAINARRAVDGSPFVTAAEFIADKSAAGYSTIKGWHGAFTHFGHKTTALALFEHFTQKGMKYEEAKKAAFESFAMNTFSGGKANRVGLMGKGLQPAAAMFLSLSNFALGTIFTAKNHFSRAFLRSGFTAAEKGRAFGALGMQMGMLWAVSGLFGLPGPGAALNILQDQFGINAKLGVEDFFEDKLGIKGSLATEGLLNSITGSDVASRSGATGLFGVNDKSASINAFGPTGSLAARLYGLGTGKSEWQDVLPSPLNRWISMYRDGGDFRDSKGSLLEEGNMQSNAIYSLFGLKPTSVREKQDYKSLVFTAEKNEHRRRENMEKEAADVLSNGGDISEMVSHYQQDEEANKLETEQQLQRVSSPSLKALLAMDPGKKIRTQTAQQKQAPIYRGISDTIFKQNNFSLGNRPVDEQREVFLGGRMNFGGMAR